MYYHSITHYYNRYYYLFHRLIIHIIFHDALFCYYSLSSRSFIPWWVKMGLVAVAPSRDVAARKRAAIDIDDQGYQNKKQKYTCKGVIPTTKDPVPCRYCSNDATVSFASKLNQDTLHLCEKCQVIKIGGWLDGVVWLIRLIETTGNKRVSALMEKSHQQSQLHRMPASNI